MTTKKTNLEKAIELVEGKHNFVRNEITLRFECTKCDSFYDFLMAASAIGVQDMGICCGSKIK